MNGECLERGEGGPFYSPNRSVPGCDTGGNADNRLLEDKRDLPAKDEHEPPQKGGRPIHGFGQTPTEAVWAHL